MLNPYDKPQLFDPDHIPSWAELSYLAYSSQLRINELMNSVKNSFNDLDAYKVVFKDTKIAQIQDIIKQFNGDLRTIQAVLSDSKFSTIKRIFNKKTDILPYFSSGELQNLYVDDKRFNTVFRFTQNDLLKFNEINQSLELADLNNETVRINTIEFIGPEDNQTYRNYDDTINKYIVLRQYNQLSVSVRMNWIQKKQINNISFNLNSFFNINISSVAYIDSKGKTIIIKDHDLPQNVNGNQQIFFPEVITDTVIVTFQISKCKATNQTSYNNPDLLIAALYDNSSYFSTLFTYSGQSLPYYYYVYHFNIGQIKVKRTIKKDEGVLASSAIRLYEPAYIGLSADFENTDAATYEFFIKTVHYSKDNTIISADPITPISLINDNKIIEKLIPITINDSEGGLVEEGKTETIAKLLFCPGDNNRKLYQNGIHIADFAYTLSDDRKYLYFEDQRYSSSNYYQFEYTPFNIEDGIFVSSQNSYASLEKEFEIIPREHQAVTDQLLGLSLRTILPYTYKDNIKIKRYVKKINPETKEESIILDTGAPEITAADYRIKGRILLLKHNTVSFPKLLNCIYRITGNIEYTLDSNYHLYYSPNNYLSYNWNYISSLQNYSHSDIYVSIVMRANKSSDLIGSVSSIKNIKLHVTTFNDLL